MEGDGLDLEPDLERDLDGDLFFFIIGLLDRDRLSCLLGDPEVVRRGLRGERDRDLDRCFRGDLERDRRSLRFGDLERER